MLGDGLQRVHVGTEPKFCEKFFFQIVSSIYAFLLYFSLEFMWLVLKAGWIYELESAKWDLDLD